MYNAIKIRLDHGCAKGIKIFGTVGAVTVYYLMLIKGHFRLTGRAVVVWTVRVAAKRAIIHYILSHKILCNLQPLYHRFLRDRLIEL